MRTGSRPARRIVATQLSTRNNGSLKNTPVTAQAAWRRRINTRIPDPFQGRLHRNGDKDAAVFANITILAPREQNCCQENTVESPDSAGQRYLLRVEA